MRQNAVSMGALLETFRWKRYFKTGNGRGEIRRGKMIHVPYCTCT